MFEQGKRVPERKVGARPKNVAVAEVGVGVGAHTGIMREDVVQPKMETDSNSKGFP